MPIQSEKAAPAGAAPLGLSSLAADNQPNTRGARYAQEQSRVRLTKPDAEEFSQALEQIGEGWFRQLALGIKLGVPEALGLTRREWSDRIGVTVRGAAERRGAVTELSAEGLSNRAIADVLGVDDRTVRRDLTGPTAANAAPTENQQGSGWDDAAAFAAGD